MKTVVTRVALVAMCVVAACKAKGQEAAKTPSTGAAGSSKMGIQQSTARVPSEGVKRVSGFASDLRVAPGGKTALVLVDAVTPPIPGVPPNLKVGTLWAAQVDGTESTKIVSGVSSVPGGLLFTPDGHYALVLGAWDPTQQSGELYSQDLTALSDEKRRLASKVTYLLASPDSKSVAFVAEGVLQVGALPAGPFKQIAGEVATAEFAGNSAHVYFRRKAAAGGGLYQVDLRAAKAAPKRIVDQVGDYAVSDDSKYVVALARSNPRQVGFELYVADAATGTPRRLAENSAKFAISSDSKWVAYLDITATKARGGSLAPQDFEKGELFVAPLASKGEPRKIGARVKEFEFTANSARLYFRDNYQELALAAGDGKVEKVGDVMTVALPDGEPKLIHRRCPNFTVSPDGKSIAYTVRIEKPEYTRHLFIAKEGSDPVQVGEWLYEYAYTPDGSALLFRTSCTRNGRSCDLKSQNIEKLEVEKPKVEAEATYNFKLSEDGKRVVYTYAHTIDESFDVAVLNWATRERKTVDQFIRLPVYFGGKKSERLVYLVDEKSRPGLYVSTPLP